MSLLVGRVFRVFEGHVEEHLQRRVDLHVVAGRDRGIGDRARLAVGGVGMRRAAVEIARELIEQDRQRERAFRRARPVVVFAARRGMVDGFETRADFGVEGLGPLEPAGGPRPTIAVL